jgi:predicted nucleic acid-binding protein
VIFVDTSFWIAGRMASERRHESAIALVKAHADQRLVTSNHVRGEVWTFMRSRFGHRVAVSVLDWIEGTPRLWLLDVEPDDEREAWAWLRRHDERPYSFVDATSFAVMRRLAIREVFAFDQDFTAAGFVELRA